MEAELSLKPGAVNIAYDPKYWVVEYLPVQKHLGYYRDNPTRKPYAINPILMFRTRFVLPIKGGYDVR